MKKLLLLKICLFAIGMSVTFSTYAQSNLAIMGPRLLVDAPSPITSTISFSYSAGIGTGSWGADITPITHQEVVKAVDSEACTALTGSYTGKWVLIYRGNCEFGAKAKKAQNAGATGVIIWNHTPNAPLMNMGAGAEGSSVTIPVIFVTHEDGRQMTNFLSGGNQMFISLTKWGFGQNNDLAIINNSPALTHAGAIPFYQFDGSTDVAAYRGYNGAFIANLGTVDQTNVQLTSEATFTPTGGASAVVYNDTATIATFAVNDSILQFFTANEYKFTPSGTGKYTFKYNVVSDSTDATPSDNAEEFSMEITSNAFCKGRFNAATQRPVINGHFGGFDGSGAALLTTWGPLFYVKKGGYTLETAIFSIEARDTALKSLADAAQDFVELFCFKWKDGSNGGATDNVIQTAELTLVSIAKKDFNPADSSNGKLLFSASWGDTEFGNNKTVTTEDDTWYWIAANLSNVFLIGGDATPNFYNRANAAKNHATNSRLEFWAPRYPSDARAVKDLTDNMLSIGFGTSANAAGNIDSAAYTSTDGVPNIAIYTTPFPTKVSKTVVNKDINLYPNPAVDKVILSYKLEQKESLVHFKIVDGFGRNVYTEDRKDVQNGEISVNTSKYTPGNYYFIMLSGDSNKSLARPFTVIGR